ncbi:MAG: TlpA family protein disulfide reductase [Bacteroidales bacterium]|nr:TlpA family protein disulfide reductase [Bacteroidales bacterium]
MKTSKFILGSIIISYILLLFVSSCKNKTEKAESEDTNSVLLENTNTAVQENTDTTSQLDATTAALEEDRGYIVEVGQMAPDFTVILTDGETFTMSENRGKVIMLQFTASWCGVCREEMPHIENEIWQPLKDKDFMLVGIDKDEPLDVVREFAGTMKITYPLALDPGAEVFSLYALKEAGVTRNVIVDQQGKIVFLTRLYEEKEFNDMKDVINSLVQ